MSKAKRVLYWISGPLLVVLAAVSIVVFLRADAVCVLFPDGRTRTPLLGSFDWPSWLVDENGEGCDPWTGIEPKRPIDEIQVGHLFESGATMTGSNFSIRPDGYGFRMTEPELGLAIDTNTLSQALRAAREKPEAFEFFYDPTLHGRVLAILEPLRDYSERYEYNGTHFPMNAYEYACDETGRLAPYSTSIAWRTLKGRADTSTTSNFGASTCPITTYANGRIETARQMIEQAPAVDRSRIAEEAM